MKIFKYEIPLHDNFTLKLPESCEIISLQVQYDKPHIWVLLDEKNELEPRYFKLFCTGYKFNYDSFIDKYIGTFQLNNGALVLHLFENILQASKIKYLIENENRSLDIKDGKVVGLK